MRTFTEEQIKKLKKNPYTFKLTKNKLYFTAKFKEDFWISYQAGNAPRKVMHDLGYDLSMFTQKQIDNYDSVLKKIKQIYEEESSFSSILTDKLEEILDFIENLI